MIVVFLGQQGAGKGEYAQRLKGFSHISMGELIREEIRNKTEIGKRIDETVRSGKLVDDETVVGLLKKRLNNAENFILDGFPRTLAQAEMLDKMLSELGAKLDMVINLKLSKEESVERISNRRMCSKCGWVCNLKNIPPKVEGKCDKCGGELYQRDDDREEVVMERLKIYEEQTKPLIDYYREKGILREVNAERDVNSVLNDIKEILGVD